MLRGFNGVFSHQAHNGNFRTITGRPSDSASDRTVAKSGESYATSCILENTLRLYGSGGGDKISAMVGRTGPFGGEEGGGFGNWSTDGVIGVGNVSNGSEGSDCTYPWEGFSSLATSVCASKGFLVWTGSNSIFKTEC